MLTLNFATAEDVDVGDAAKKEDVPDRIQGGLGYGKPQVTDASDFLPGDVNDLPQHRSQRLMSQPRLVAQFRSCQR